MFTAETTELITNEHTTGYESEIEDDGEAKVFATVLGQALSQAASHHMTLSIQKNVGPFRGQGLVSDSARALPAI